jgi:hypothetical protein
MADVFVAVGVVRSAIAIAPGAVFGALSVSSAGVSSSTNESRGRGWIYGSVLLATGGDAPLGQNVVLLDARSMNLVDKTVSNPKTGHYEFKWIQMGIPYFVATIDPDGLYAPAAKTAIYPELVP